MSATASTIYLLDAAGAEVEAQLVDEIGDDQLIDWANEWQPFFGGILAELRAKGVPRSQWPQSAHWVWPRKVEEVRGVLAHRTFAVTAAGVTQGLMRVDLTGVGRLTEHKGKPSVYAEYLEVAPWNQAELVQSPRFRGVGTALFTAAVQLSADEGFAGRVSLHSLPQADDFYRSKCDMRDLGPDASYPNNLRYFELTAAAAQRFL